METQTTKTTGTATYSPEDNKLRLYVGRVSREEFLKLRAEGWITLHKQRESGGGDFASVWTPSRRDTALEYGGGIILDEDMGPAERAADRAERFSGYRDKRTGEAGGYADAYESGPSAHGYQSEARAERAAARHDRIGDKAGDAWNKAEYWQRRTAGVIAHALHLSAPGVRMGRIKTLEAELRKEQASIKERTDHWQAWKALAEMTDTTKQNELARLAADCLHGTFTHPTTGAEVSMYTIAQDQTVTGAQIAALYLAKYGEPRQENDWTQHLTLRIAYEVQMCEAAGGRAADVEMIPGGFICARQIRKVVKSPVTGRVVSVEVMGTRSGFTRESGYKEHATRAVPVLVNIERAGADAYRAPTPEELTAFQAAMKAEKEARPKTIKPPLVNPTDADAERLVSIWNEKRRAEHDAKNIYSSEAARKSHADQFKPCTVERVTQAVYSANSKGSYAKAETCGLCSLGRLEERQRFYDYEGQATRKAERGPVLCQIRVAGYDPKRVIILTDKPQKALPGAVWESYTPIVPALVAPETVNA